MNKLFQKKSKFKKETLMPYQIKKNIRRYKRKGIKRQLAIYKISRKPNRKKKKKKKKEKIMVENVTAFAENFLLVRELSKLKQLEAKVARGILQEALEERDEEETKRGGKLVMPG